MESSNLQKLLVTLLQPLQTDPEAVIAKLIPPDKMRMWMMVKGLAATFKFNPGDFLVGFAHKVESLPTEFWLELEDCLIGVIDGEPEAIEKAKQILGVK